MNFSSSLVASAPNAAGIYILHGGRAPYQSVAYVGEGGKLRERLKADRAHDPRFPSI